MESMKWKLLLFTDIMIAYVKNSKEFWKTILELVTEFTIYLCVCIYIYIYIYNETGIILMKYMQDLFAKKYKTLIQETGDLNKREHLLYPWIGRQYIQHINSSQFDL